VTKQEAISKARTLLGILEVMPDGVDIMQESASECTSSNYGKSGKFFL